MRVAHCRPPFEIPCTRLPYLLSMEVIEKAKLAPGSRIPIRFAKEKIDGGRTWLFELPDDLEKRLLADPRSDVER